MLGQYNAEHILFLTNKVKFYLSQFTYNSDENSFYFDNPFGKQIKKCSFTRSAPSQYGKINKRKKAKRRKKEKCL